MSKIIAKIKALRARAADAASSEAEAAKAAAVADKLMREHNISLSELDVRAEGVGKVFWNPDARMRGPETFAAKKVADALGIECWCEAGRIAFLGSPADVEVALYYMDLCSNAAEAGVRAFRKTDDYARLLRQFSPRKIGADFRKGVCSRLGQRIADQIYAEQTPVATGTGIVLVKDALIRAWLEENDMRFKKARATRVGGAWHNGRAHAEGVGIGRGVGVQRSGQGLLA